MGIVSDVSGLGDLVGREDSSRDVLAEGGRCEDGRPSVDFTGDRGRHVG